MSSALSPSRCVILVPSSGPIEVDCERGLRVLEETGYTVRRVYGYANIDQARNQMATEALSDGFEELLWIDSDVRFDPKSVERLRSHDEPIVCGIYPKKGRRELACHVLPGTTELVFGEGGGIVPLLYAATGFLLTHRRVYEAIRETCNLPVCNRRFQSPVVPYFLPLIKEEDGGESWYLGEDYAFCERARLAGFSVLADTTIRLQHIGKHGFSWEEAGLGSPRYASFRYVLV